MNDTQPPKNDEIMQSNMATISQETADQSKEVSGVVEEKQSHPTSIQGQEKLTLVDGLDTTGTITLLSVLESKTNEEAAGKLGITRQALWLRIKKYKIDEIIADFPKQALMRLQLGSTRAAEKLVEKLDDRRESLQAATEILDRVGLSGDKPVNVQVNTQVNLDKYMEDTV